MIVRRLKPLPVEAVVRGYLIGSGWKDYQRSGTVCGIALPPGLEQAAQLPEPIFTPATKAAAGQHDENVSFEVIEQDDRLRDSRRSVRDLALRALRASPPTTRSRAASSSPTRSSSSGSTRAARSS